MFDRPIHPACALWPRPSDEEVQAIAADIKANGLLNPIWLFEGAILDGKTRLEACGIAGVEPRFKTYAGDDHIGFVVSQNARRRHIAVGAVILIVAELATLKRGGDRRSKDFKVPAGTLVNEDIASTKKETRSFSFDNSTRARLLVQRLTSQELSSAWKSTCATYPAPQPEWLSMGLRGTSVAESGCPCQRETMCTTCFTRPNTPRSLFGWVTSLQ